MSQQATLYRMQTDEHVCPFGLRAKDLLERKGYDVEDRPLSSREETDAFKQKHGVETTPQAFIDGERIGGYEELREYFGMDGAGQSGTTYTPVVAIFSVSALMTLAVQWYAQSAMLSISSLLMFIGVAMTLLALQKLQDVHSFTNSFITYDLLAMRHLRYGNAYPFLEAYAGIGMIAGIHPLLVAPASLFIGLVGGISVFKAVYIDKRELKCACVGGDSNVPLGFVSFTENVFMVLGGALMLTML